MKKFISNSIQEYYGNLLDLIKLSKIQLVRISTSIVLGTFLFLIIIDLRLIGDYSLDDRVKSILIAWVALIFCFTLLTNFDSLKKKKINFSTDLKLYIYAIVICGLELLLMIIFFRLH
jgi:hypothetical protein